MKSLLLSVLLVSAAAASMADAPSVTGNWKVHSNIAGYESDLACAFTQKDAGLTGSCKSDQGEVSVSGKVAEQKITWTYKSEYNGSPITIVYDGSLDSAGKISGTVKVEEFNVEGEFTANVAK